MIDLRDIYVKIYKNILKNTWSGQVFAGIGIGSIFAGLTIRESFSASATSENTVQAISLVMAEVLVPILLAQVFLMIKLVAIYFREYVDALQIFNMLGISRKSRNRFLIEIFGLFWVIDLLIGVFVGGVFLAIIRGAFFCLVDTSLKIKFSWIPLLITSLMWFLLFLVILNFSYSSWLKQKYKNEPKEWKPSKHYKIVGLISIAVMMILIGIYSELARFENKEIVCGTLVVFYVFVRALTAYKSKKDIVIRYHWLDCHSRTVSIYSVIIADVLTCALCFGNLNISTTMTSEDTDSIYPYEVVCYAYEEDLGEYENIRDTYNLQMISVPMVRVSNMDTTDAIEYRGETPIQGQQMGISETSYNLLKLSQNVDYKTKDLQLDAEGKKVYIVHQQDRSVRAQPIDYWLWSSSPLLYMGQPCSAMGYGTALETRETDSGYSFRTVVGEEIGSLIGIFDCTGKQENIVVMSDEYFEKASQEWKRRNKYTGEVLTEDEQADAVEYVKEGPTTLLLFDGIENGDFSDIKNKLDNLQSRHQDDFKYSSKIKNLYYALEAKEDLNQTRGMKMSGAMVQIIVAIMMIMELLAIELLSSKKELLTRDYLLKCLGLGVRDRRQLIIKDMTRPFRYGTIGAIVISGGLVWATFKARMFDLDLIKENLIYLLVIGGTELLVARILRFWSMNAWLKGKE